MRTRADILNYLIHAFSYTRYLEIGVLSGKNFAGVRCKHKEGVDPNVKCTHQTTSDKFFVNTSETWDLIFVDGDHDEQQVDRDVRNALAHLTANGTMVLHDCNPPTEWHQRTSAHVVGRDAWNGRPWKSIAKLRIGRPDLAVCVVDTDFGVGVVRCGRQKLFDIPAGFALNYKSLAEHRKALLNLISVDEFVRWLKEAE